MFGFIRLNAENKPSATPGPRPEILVSSEDIYRHDVGHEPILLLRRGFELTPDELPRFLKNGAQRHQFHYKHTGQSLAKTPVPIRNQRFTHGMSNSILSPNRNTGKVPQKQVLMIEPEQKNLKRLVDCLFVCGVPLDQIHPVRMVSNVPWAVEKYRPQILIASYELSSSIDGLTLLQAFADLSYVETLILLLPANGSLSEEELITLQEHNHQKRIKLLRKPVNRFDLQRLLKEPNQHTSSALRAMNEKPVA